MHTWPAVMRVVRDHVGHHRRSRRPGLRPAVAVKDFDAATRQRVRNHVGAAGAAVSQSGPDLLLRAPGAIERRRQLEMRCGQAVSISGGCCGRARKWPRSSVPCCRAVSPATPSDRAGRARSDSCARLRHSSPPARGRRSASTFAYGFAIVDLRTVEGRLRNSCNYPPHSSVFETMKGAAAR